MSENFTGFSGHNPQNCLNTLQPGETAFGVSHRNPRKTRDRVSWPASCVNKHGRVPLAVTWEMPEVGLKESTMVSRILVLASTLFVGLVGSAQAGVAVVIPISEPVSLAIFGGGVGALYLIKKLRD